MKKLKINIEADLSEDLVEELYEGFDVSTDKELAALLKGVMLSSMEIRDYLPISTLNVTIEEDAVKKGVLN